MKAIICEIKNKHNPRLKIWGTSWLTSFQQRFRPNYRYKTDRSDLESLESSLPQKEVGPFPDTITLRPTMLLNNNWNTIQKQENLSKYINTLPGSLILYIDNTMLIAVAVIFMNTNTARTCKNVRMRQTVKWSNHLIHFLEKKIKGACMRAQLNTINKNLVWVAKNPTVCFLPSLGSQKKVFVYSIFFQAKVSVLFRTAWNHNYCCPLWLFHSNVEDIICALSVFQRMR